MNKTILLALGVIILILTFAGVYLASSYKTSYSISTFSAQEVNGKYILKVQVIMNYGPFGGKSPLQDATIWVKNQNSFYQNFTNSQGIAEFYLPAGNYSVEVTQLNHYTLHVNINSDTMISISYAYLRS